MSKKGQSRVRFRLITHYSSLITFLELEWSRQYSTGLFQERCDAGLFLRVRGFQSFEAKLIPDDGILPPVFFLSIVAG